MKKIPRAVINIFSRKLHFLLVLLIISLSGFSQNVGVNTTGAQPNSSAGLDVDFPDKGLLIPRVSLTSTTSFAPLSAHVAGMFVYNTNTANDVKPGFYYNNGANWMTGFPAGNAIGNMLYWNGSAWVLVPAGSPGQYLQMSGANIPVWGATTFGVLTTTAASAITGITATSGGNITADGGSAILSRGVCWKTATGPTIADTKTADGSGLGSFSSSLTGLLPVTTYYVRAYAMNSTTISYGNEVSFTTLPVLPTLAATTAASAITGTTATTGGNVTNTGGATITERGVCYGTSLNPAITGSKVIDPSPALGTFSCNLTGLTGYTTYHVRAYATSSAGTGYGTDISFTTLKVPPTLTTTVASGITGSAAISGGSMSWNGGGYSNYQAYGVAYSTTSNSASPTKVATNSNNGSVNPLINITPWITNLSGLTSNTTYYIRSYLDIYPTGTGPWATVYGNELSFTTTAPTAPVVGSTIAVTGLSANTANSGGTITSDGGSAITAKGVCWGTSPGPTLGVGNFTSDGTGTATFSSSMTGLTGSTTYYVRAYATNSVGTSFGPTSVSFTTWVQAPYTLFQVLSYGIVGYIAQDGTGFIVSPEIPSQNGWGCNGVNVTGTSAALGTGQANTAAILACSIGTTTAASVASSYTGGGFNDWYLPSAGDWAQIAANYYRYALNGNKMYYTSSQYGTNYNYATAYFNTGSQAYSSGLNRVPTVSDLSLMTGILAIRNFAAATLPTVTTAAITNIAGTTATSGGTVTSDGGDPTTVRGVCWSTNPNPTITDPKTTDGTGAGAFVSSITGLTANTVYYVRAYATNILGTAYGAQISFNSGAVVLNPTVSTDPMGSLVGAIAESNYTVVNEGATPVLSAGVVWGTSAGPTTTSNIGMVTDPYYVAGSSNGFSWPLDITGLTVGTTYYLRAFATNSNGTAYGSDVSFTATAAFVGQSVSLNYASGTVFSISGGGAHGLMALSFDPGVATDWGCSNSVTGATGTLVGTGNTNTTSIINDIIANTCTSTSPFLAYAAEVCKWYGYPDWYLPSKDELDLARANITLSVAAPLWSSSEVSATNSWYYDGTTWVSGAKTLFNNVLPIRSF